MYRDISVHCNCKSILWSLNFYDLKNNFQIMTLSCRHHCINLAIGYITNILLMHRYVPWGVSMTIKYCAGQLHTDIQALQGVHPFLLCSRLLHIRASDPTSVAMSGSEQFPSLFLEHCHSLKSVLLRTSRQRQSVFFFPLSFYRNI